MEVNLDSEEELVDEMEEMEDGEEVETEAEELEDAPEDEPESDGEGQPFDITLAATHSYMGEELVSVGGRSVLEAGWAGRLPARAHRAAVFPGETVPMLFNNPHDVGLITEAINTDKLFGLLFPDESGQVLSGYGVVCEVFEAARGGGAGAVTVKARAAHRFRLARPNEASGAGDGRLRLVSIRVLPEMRAAAPLRHARLASLDPLRSRQNKMIKTLDAAVTPWPLFVYEIFDYDRMREIIREYFATLKLDHLLPTEAVSLSFWTAANLGVAARERLALFAADGALQRLHLAAALVRRRGALACACGARLAHRDDVFAMSSAGVSSNYTNLGGFVHDVVTLRAARGLALAGAAERHYSWFPGYAWRVATCAACGAHVGWRFTATSRALRPAAFYGLCRHLVQPRDLRADHDDP